MPASRTCTERPFMPAAAYWVNNCKHRCREVVRDRDYVAHIGRIGEEKLDQNTGEKRYPARRWVVERTLG